ncbi:MAG: ATP-dependent zinc metalloprotease FtsH [Thermoleophilia bacterium]
MAKFLRSAAFPILIVVLLAFFVMQIINNRDTGAKDMNFGEFVTNVKNHQVKSVTVEQKDHMITVVLKDSDREINVGYTEDYPLTQLLLDNDVPNTIKGTGSSMWSSLLISALPILLIVVFWLFMMNQMQGGGNKVMSFGKSRAKRMTADQPKVTFKDVAGVEEAVEELQEIKEFLENPRKFQNLGAKIPKGVLLYGPPGTGKTLLARGVAGEAGVPFFSISGSDFVEMFVGVGASRVRDLFEQAKQNAPCIIFIDEIDAVGRHRGAGMGGGHDEREQTLNQLLVEMDGFEMKDNVIMIAATNRPDILDPALLRPGRFDRQIVVDRPDRKGREEIIRVHTRGKPLAKDIHPDVLAAQTPGFTGADLANLVNEAALLAARHGKKEIGMIELEEGIMRVVAGPEKKSRILSEKEKLITAYHEVGHAIVGHFLPNADPIHKVSVISRGQALGYTISLPSEDRFLVSKSQLVDRLAATLGGRAAEEIRFDEVTSGAANDLQQATSIAKQMIMRYGMSERLGPRTFGHDHAQPFLGREFSQEPDYSNEIAQEIDEEINRVIEAAHTQATEILTGHREQMDQITEILVEYETLEKAEFEGLLDGKSPEEVFKHRDADKNATPPPDEETTRRRLTDRKKESATDILPKEPPLESPSYTQAIDPGEAAGGPDS